MKTLLLLLPLLALAPAATRAQRLAPTTLAPATRTVSGRVTDAWGQPLPGVTVLLKGTPTATASDSAGRYRLARVPVRGGVLVFSFVGFATRERPVPAKGAVLNVVLASDQKTLKEVVVTGAAPAPRAQVSYSAAAVTVLAGRAAGVSVGRAERKARRVESAGAYDALHNAGYASPLPAPAPLAYPARPEAGAGDTYAHVEENAFRPVQKEPLSTFSLDVDNASYTNVRRFLNEGQLPPRDAVRVEEMLNYFKYQLPAPPPASPDPVRISAELSECPWAAGHQLARIGIQARQVETTQLPPANLVFLVDVSGSMNEADKLPLVQAGLRLLVRQLRPQDHVALVAYAGAAGLVLPPTPGNKQEAILAAIDQLQAGGSTAGGAGLRLAYSVAGQNFLKEGNNRVVLATDGDFNVGESSDTAMEQLIVAQRETGVFLTVLGCGRGNLRDSRMELLADKGNGNYAYLDNLDEARRTLVAQFGGTLFTVAKDVKLQIELEVVYLRVRL